MFDGILRRTSSLTWRRPRALLAAIFLFAAVAGFFGHDVEEHLAAAGFSDPASESEVAGRVLADELGHAAEPGLVVLIRAKDGGKLDLTSPALQAEVARLAAQTAKGEYVGPVDNPLAAKDPAATGLVAADGKSLVLTAHLTDPDVEDKGGIADESVRKLVTSDMVDVGFGGYAPGFNEVNDQTREDLTKAELIAFPILGILLFLVFRSAVAMFIPLIVGGLSIVGTLLALRIMSNFVDTSLFALNIATALSLGLAVDYALLMVSRHREEVAKHGYTELALSNTVASAGRTVLFSGLTVAGAMAALVLMPQRFLYSIGVAGGVVGVLSASMAVLVVPALLSWLGPNVNKLSVRRGGAAVSDISQGWLRMARGVMRRPVLVAVATTTFLLALAVPLAGTHLTGPSSQAVPPGAQAYGVTKYLNAHYPRAVMEGVSLTVTGKVSDAELETLRTEVTAVPHVDPKSPVPPFTRVSETVAVTTAAFDGPALSDQSQDALHKIRKLSASADTKLLVSGNTARFIDQKESLASNAPLVVGLIVLLTLVLLFLLTGSVLLPLKTLLMNALTLSAVLGILVIVFEKKVGASLIDYPGPYSVEVTSMVFLFVVTFALATDYAVLVMARIKELRDGGLSNEEAVAQGIARTGRIISAAALMIAVVFMAFAVSPVFFMKQIAVGMALAVIIDATIVRALLVPSLMRLLGEANWWAPKPLRRFHDKFGIREG